MKVFGKCQECEKEVSFFSFIDTRVDLVMDKGEFIEVKCKECGSTSKFHVDELYAKESKLYMIISLVVLLIGTPLIMMATFQYNPDGSWVWVVGGFFLIPSVIYGLMRKNERERVSRFNRMKYKGHL